MDMSKFAGSMFLKPVDVESGPFPAKIVGSVNSTSLLSPSTTGGSYR